MIVGAVTRFLLDFGDLVDMANADKVGNLSDVGDSAGVRSPEIGRDVSALGLPPDRT